MKDTTIKSILLAVCAALLYGACTPTPIAVTNRIMESHDRRMYLDYRREAERVNLERERAGLPPNRIMGGDEWAGAAR